MSPRRTRAPEERFWPKVNRGTETECWEWAGGYGSGGYGSFWMGPSGCFDAHRASYILAHGTIPSGMVVMHSCDNRKCVNPSHLSLGTTRDNVQDMCRKGRSSRQLQTHCKSGHPFNETNTFRQSNGARGCRTCSNQWSREWKRRNRTR